MIVEDEKLPSSQMDLPLPSSQNYQRYIPSAEIHEEANNADAERQNEEHAQRRDERNRVLLQERQREREREREFRLRDVERDVQRLRQNLPPLVDPYDSAESGYWSINDRRRKSRTEQMWERMRERNLRMRASEDRQRKKEEKKELDAMFHVMLHGSHHEGHHSCSYEYELPAFMNFHEIEKGFKEQLAKENAMRKEKEEAEEKAKEVAIKEKYRKMYQQKRQKSKARSRSSYTKNSEVVEIQGSSDEEDSAVAITKRAMQWSGCRVKNNTNATPNSSTTTSSTRFTATTGSNATITVHDSDSE